MDCLPVYFYNSAPTVESTLLTGSLFRIEQYVLKLGGGANADPTKGLDAVARRLCSNLHLLIPTNSCNKIPDKKSLREETFILAYGSRGAK